MNSDINKKALEVIFDTVYNSNMPISEVICKMKQRGLTQWQTHYILWVKLGDKNLFTFSGLRSHIVNAPCWLDSVNQNISLDDEFENFLKKSDIADL